MCFVSKILRNPTFQRMFPFPLVTRQAKRLFQIVILRLRVKLPFGHDQKHPKPHLVNDMDNPSQLAIHLYPVLTGGF